MLVYEYKCLDCNAFFEEANSDLNKVSCLFCNSRNISKSDGDNWKGPQNSCSDCDSCGKSASCS